MNGYDAQIAARALNLDGAADQPRDENGRWSAGSAPNAHSKLWAERVTQVASSVRELNQRSNTLFKENVAAAQDARKFAENIDKNLDVGDSDETTKDAAVKEEAYNESIRLSKLHPGLKFGVYKYDGHAEPAPAFVGVPALTMDSS